MRYNVIKNVSYFLSQQALNVLIMTQIISRIFLEGYSLLREQKVAMAIIFHWCLW